MTKEELKEKAEEILKEFPTANKVYATVDGNVFLEENRARLHATVKGTVMEFTREPVLVETSGDKPAPAKEVIEAIKIAETKEDLEAFATDTRKSVKDAFEKRLAEIEANDPENNSN